MAFCDQLTVAAGLVVAMVLASHGIAGLEITKGLRVRLLSDETSFNESFRRFPNDEVNGLSSAKLDRLGQEVEILETYADETVTCRFDDGVQYDMPIEAFGLRASGQSLLTSSEALGIKKSEASPESTYHSTYNSTEDDEHHSELAMHLGACIEERWDEFSVHKHTHAWTDRRTDARADGCVGGRAGGRMVE